MPRLRQRLTDSWPVFCTIAIIAFALLGASTAFAIVDAVTLNLSIKAWRAISVTAAVTGCFALLSIVVLTTCRLGCSGAWLHRWLLPWTCALVAMVAAVLSINALVLKAINGGEVEHVQHGHTDVVAQLALWK